LGFSPEKLALFKSWLQQPQGMIIITGPTGSGKTSTLYNALQFVATENVNVVTVEDPVEYVLPRITQIQVHEAAGMTLGAGLRAILRQDPDIIVVPNSSNTALLTLHPQGARLWNYEGKLLAFFGPHELRSISWSPDNQIVATAGSSGVRLWNADDGKRIQTLPRISLWNILENVDYHSCDAVSFSSNGQIIAAICRFPGKGVFDPGVFKDGLRLWSRDGQELWSPDENGYDSYVFSPDSQTLAVKHKEQLILLKLSVSKK
jgi:WD40 repeat protein